MWSLTAGAATAQRKGLRHDAEAYMPCAEGTNWRWRRTTTIGDHAANAGVAIVNRGVFGTYRRADGSRWHLIATSAGSPQPAFEHWNTEGPGLLVEASETADGARSSPACWLAAPVGAVSQWQWTEERQKATIEHRASIVGFEEVVTVPAGTFRSVHVQIVAIGGDEVETHDLWFARGTGLVRSTRKVGEQSEETVLLAMIRGRDQTGDRLATLQVLAPPDWLWGPKGNATVKWLDQDPGSVAFGGRFAIVDNSAARRIAFVRPGSLVEVTEPSFDWRSIQPTETRMADPLRLSTLGRLHAERLGLWDIRIETVGDNTELAGTGPNGLQHFTVAHRGYASIVQARNSTNDDQGPNDDKGR